MYTLVVNPIDLSHISANLDFISHNESFQCKVMYYRSVKFKLFSNIKHSLM